MVLLGDNIFENSIESFTKNYEKEQRNKDPRVLLVEVNVPQRFGIAALDEKRLLKFKKNHKGRKATTLLWEHIFMTKRF